MRWPLRSYNGGYRDQLIYNYRDKGGHKAHDLEALRIFSFSFFPRVPRFSFNDKVVLVRNAYGLRALSGGTACG